MTIRELYEWAKARNAEDMTLHVDTWNELFNEWVESGIRENCNMMQKSLVKVP